MEGGWLKLYRCLINKPIWQCTTPEQKAILITLLCMVNHEEKEWIWQGKKYKCRPGQMVTSLKRIAESSGTSIQNVRTALKNFEEIYEFLTSESTNKNRLITIVNWELYQASNTELTDKTTSNQQAPNKHLTTNKNDKNDKNDKEVYRESRTKSYFVPPSIEQVKEYCQERNNNVDPEKWYDFYSSKGWMIGKNKMKDWKAAVRTWERRSGKNEQSSNPFL